jgi:hypothetical protein
MEFQEGEEKQKEGERIFEGTMDENFPNEKIEISNKPPNSK